MEKWTVESAIEWVRNHGYKMVAKNDGRVTLVLDKNAGLKALSCADFLRKVVHMDIAYPSYPRGE